MYGILSPGMGDIFLCGGWGKLLRISLPVCFVCVCQLFTSLGGGQKAEFCGHRSIFWETLNMPWMLQYKNTVFPFRSHSGSYSFSALNVNKKYNNWITDQLLISLRTSKQLWFRMSGWLVIIAFIWTEKALKVSHLNVFFSRIVTSPWCRKVPADDCNVFRCRSGVFGVFTWPAVGCGRTAMQKCRIWGIYMPSMIFRPFVPKLVLWTLLKAFCCRKKNVLVEQVQSLNWVLLDIDFFRKIIFNKQPYYSLHSFHILLGFCKLVFVPLGCIVTLSSWIS